MPSSSSSSGSASSGRYVVLSQRQSSEYVDGRTVGCRVRLEVTEASEITEDIFVFLRSTNPVVGADPIDEFDRVASPSDIDTYAADEPDTGQSYFRLPITSLVFRNPDLLEQTLADIDTDILELVQTLDRLDTLVDETVII